eukprot:1889255-Prymnesium_polylepis.1
MAHQTTIATCTQHESSAGSPFPCVFLKLKKASCPIPVHYRSATRLRPLAGRVCRQVTASVPLAAG